MKVYFFSANIQQYNNAFSVLHVQVCFKSLYLL